MILKECGVGGVVWCSSGTAAEQSVCRLLVFRVFRKGMCDIRVRIVYDIGASVTFTMPFTFSFEEYVDYDLCVRVL